MRNNTDGFEAAMPGAEVAGPPSKVSPMKLSREQNTISHDFAFPKSLQRNTDGFDKFRGENMDRESSTSSGATDDFNSSQSSAHGASSPAQLSRSSSMASDHPWASMFPDGAAGAMTSMARTEHSNPIGPSAVNMSLSNSSSSSSGNDFKMPAAVQRLKSGGSMNSTSTSGSVLNQEEIARYQPIEVKDLIELIKNERSSTTSESTSMLLLDIRPSTSFVQSRVKGSINICAPSTLLKRSGVTVERIEEEMLSSESDQAQFSGWKRGPQKDGIKRAYTNNPKVPTIERIIVLDTDTASAAGVGKPSAGGGGPCLLGLLRKFDLAGYAGQLYWLVGGFNGFSKVVNKEANVESEFFIDRQPLEASSNVTSIPKGPSLVRSDSSRRSSAPIEQSKKNGFDLHSPSTQRQQSLVHPKGLPMEAFSASTTTQRRHTGMDRRQMQGSSSHPTFDIEGRPAVGESGTSACANPFFDNIRQNRELQHGITERVPLELPHLTSSDVGALPLFLRTLVHMEATERTEQLAKKFFDIEKAEQRRLIATMQQHAAESNLSGQENYKREQVSRRLSGSLDALQLSSTYCSVANGKNCSNQTKETFPFSIAAALEKGDENRYNNIWTFEHSRIRCANAEQYLNGSYLEPSKEYGCRRRYIATQAPLPSTFATFWTVVWQQNARTICMVTRQFESGRIQSHNYWKDAKYGDVEVRILEEISLDANGNAMKDKSNTKEENDGGNLFANASVNINANGSLQAHTLKRKFALTKGKETREVIQLQFIAWPDFSIPDDAKGILHYIDMASAEQHRAEVELRKVGSEVGPLVVHCSAGVGRTGTYVVIDSVLDVLRRLRRAKNQQWQSTDVWDSSNVNTSSKSTDIQDIDMLSPTNGSTLSPFPLHLSQPRRSLKRELSPSAMDITKSDEIERRNSLANSAIKSSSSSSTRSSSDISSPPSMRRGRSDEVEEWQGTKVGSFSSPLRNPSSGLETPSGAMGSMKIAWESPIQTPPRITKEGAKSGSEQISISGVLPDVMLSPTGGPLAPLGPSGAMATTLPTFGSFEEVDLIQKAVETIREQRMSTVQTGRQYVFAYRAVIEGVLLEVQREAKEQKNS